MSERKRFRDLGRTLGLYPTGPYNAITDVEGVLVGHCTISHGDGPLVRGKGPARTGVTAILPNSGRIFTERLVGGGFVLNGAGEISGLTQVLEWGLVETPILLTNTLAIGTCSESLVDWMVNKHGGIGKEHDVIIPLVGECDDSWLNDTAGRHVRAKHVVKALETAAGGPVAEGTVGAGTGMVTCDLAGGIGTSSRRVRIDEDHEYTVGILVMSNFGYLEDLRVDGEAVGRRLAKLWGTIQRRVAYGSIISVVATDAPLNSHQLARLAKRSALGIGRTGSIAAHGSGEIVLAFSTGNAVPREFQEKVYKLDVLGDPFINPLYEATIDATQEAILNALCMAHPTTGRDGNHARALPLEEIVTPGPGF